MLLFPNLVGNVLFGIVSKSAELRKESHYFFKLVMIGDLKFRFRDHRNTIFSRHSLNRAMLASRLPDIIIEFERNAPIRASTSAICCFPVSCVIRGSTTDRL